MEDRVPYGSDTGPLVFVNARRTPNELVQFEKNPRKITAAKRKQLSDLVTRFGMISTPVVDADNRLVSGHQRVKVLQLLGRGGEPVDVRLASRKMTEAEFKEINLIENAKFGEWDADLLQQEFGEFLDEYDFGIDFAALDQAVEQAVGGKPDEPELPVVAKMMEKYQAVVIVCRTEIEATNIGECLGLDKARSYKSGKVGISNVITAEQFQDAWKSRQSQL